MHEFLSQLLLSVYICSRRVWTESTISSLQFFNFLLVCDLERAISLLFDLTNMLRHQSIEALARLTT